MTAKNNVENIKDIKAYLGEDTVFSGTLSFILMVLSVSMARWMVRLTPTTL
jgi:hypothetical protein